jgi:hypothetical protein
VVPVAGLTASTAYTLTVSGVTDLAGNAMSAPLVSTFTTGAVPDFSQPVVASITPNNDATGVLTTSTIQIQFSKFMDSLSITGPTITVTTNGVTQIPGTISVNPSGTIATFTPTTQFATTTVYSVSVSSSITDLGGSALTAFQSTFTTGSQ